MIPLELQRTLRWLLPLLGVLAAAIVKVTAGTELGVLVLASVVLVGVIFLLWNSVQALTGDTELTLEEAMGMAAPSVEEEQKRSVLRTLKDLEYERSVGKISDEDYRELVHVYRERAKRLIQVVDEENQDSHERAERLIQKRLKAAKVSAKSRPSAQPSDDEPTAEAAEQAAKDKPDPKPIAARDDELEQEEPRVADADDGEESDADTDVEESGADDPKLCPDCDTENDADARFCKRCGTDLEEAS